MLLHRFSDHLRTQNWVAILLDLIVVFVGIFLAVQVDRWYANERLLSDEGQHLAALAEDFEAARENIERTISRHRIAQAAAEKLLGLDANVPITNNDFYRLVAEAQLTATLEPKRRTYDALIATGKIDVLRDKALTAELGDFYSVLERQLRVRQRWDNDLASTWFPYVTKHIDHVALVKFAHPEDARSLAPTHAPDRFQGLIGTDEFEGAIVFRWHFAHDRAAGLANLLERVKHVQSEIEQNLARYTN